MQNSELAKVHIDSEVDANMMITADMLRDDILAKREEAGKYQNSAELNDLLDGFELMLEAIDTVIEEEYASPIEANSKLYEISVTLNQAWQDLVKE